MASATIRDFPLFRFSTVCSFPPKYSTFEPRFTTAWSPPRPSARSNAAEAYSSVCVMLLPAAPRPIVNDAGMSPPVFMALISSSIWNLLAIIFSIFLVSHIMQNLVFDERMSAPCALTVHCLISFSISPASVDFLSSGACANMSSRLSTIMCATQSLSSL